uniref:60S ribosomal protein L2, mitochondrial n=1 Tax=Manihot esculenta TaxID=3983 RepID=A0A2C9WPI3_MANES
MAAANALAAASHSGKYGVQAWQAFKTRSSTAGKGTAIGISVGKTGGRSSAGRITVFHRGGGAKRLHRRIDLKRSTSSMGVIERIEYDPNRSSRIALIRWVEGGPLRLAKKFKAVEEFAPPQKILDSITTTTPGLFSLASLSREGDQRKVAYSCRSAAAYAVVGPQTGMSRGLKSLSTTWVSEGKKTSVGDVFLFAFSTPRAEPSTLSFCGSLNFPRIAVAGAKPNYFAPQLREKDGGKSTFSLSEVRKWNSQSNIWAHRMKRKAAVSWQSFKLQNTRCNNNTK